MAKESMICKLLTELCVAELEEAAGESDIHQFCTVGLGLGLGFPQPIIQESSHPYTDDVTLTGLNCFGDIFFFNRMFTFMDLFKVTLCYLAVNPFE